MRLHDYPDYRWLRGFNIIPSWGARIEQAWWEYDGGLRAGLDHLREPPRFTPPWRQENAR